MQDIIVVKFGGSVLESEVGISRAANMVKKIVDRGLHVLVVVSALKGVTDNLIQLTKKVNPDTTPALLDDVLSMGERTSAKIFTNALLARNLDAIVIDPLSEEWPIMTDTRHLDANPVFEETKKRVDKKIRPLLEDGKIPVLGGFIGLSESGEITTLGRGGSDTTAILLGSCLGAKEVVLVKDVYTVFSSDPEKVEHPVPIQSLDSEEAYLLSSGGAEFLHSKALYYKDDKVRVRIASLADDGLSGTVIDGVFPDLEIECSEEPISMITIVGFGSNGADQIGVLTEKVKEAGGRIISLTLSEKSVILYVTRGERILNRLHDFVVGDRVGKALSIFEELTMVTVKGRAMETIPGMIQRVSQPLAHSGINIYGLITISSSIRVFIARDEGDKAVSLLKKALITEKMGG